MLLERSSSKKQPSPAKKGMTTNPPAVHRCHPSFSHVEDEELQRGIRRPKPSRTQSQVLDNIPDFALQDLHLGMEEVVILIKVLE